jgi:transcriptional regulator with XRE-family HTH domain
MPLSIKTQDMPTGNEAVLWSQRTREADCTETVWGNYSLFSDLAILTPFREPRTWESQYNSLVEGTPLRQIVRGITGYGQMLQPLIGSLLIVLTGPSCSHSSATTSYSIMIRPDPIAPATLEPFPTLSTQETSRLSSAPVAQLKETSGLEISQLCTMLGISRTTYHKWLKGTSPRGKNRNHLLQVLLLIEEASKRYEDPKTLANWLFTPISAGGRNPADILASKQYSTFLGCLLKRQAPKDQPRRLFAQRRLKKVQLRDELETYNPRPFPDDYEE